MQSYPVGRPVQHGLVTQYHCLSLKLAWLFYQTDDFVQVKMCFFGGLLIVFC